MSITDGTELLDSSYYAENGPPHEIWTKLRAESPVHRCESADYPPFWAITKHEDICRISREPEAFLSYPGITMQRKGEVIDREEGVGAMRTIIEMDPPAHRSYRKVASPFFKPGQMKHIDGIVEESAKQLLDDLAGTTGKGECDFAMKVAVAHPLRVLSTILGVPRDQEQIVKEGGDEQQDGAPGRQPPQRQRDETERHVDHLPKCLVRAGRPDDGQALPFSAAAVFRNSIR